jgi:hypothetical protein
MLLRLSSERKAKDIRKSSVGTLALDDSEDREYSPSEFLRGYALSGGRYSEVELLPLCSILVIFLDINLFGDGLKSCFSRI